MTEETGKTTAAAKRSRARAAAAPKSPVGEVPATATSGQTYDSTEDNVQLQMPSVASAPISDPGEVLGNPHVADLNRLHNFLITNYPQEFNRTNRQKPESAVEIAMRLLSGTTHSRVPTCQAQFCNLPLAHQGDHGWVQVQAASRL